MAEINNDILRAILSALSKGNLHPLEELEPESKMEQTRIAIKRGLIAADGAFRGGTMSGAGIDLNAYHITPIGKMWLKKLGRKEEASGK